MDFVISFLHQAVQKRSQLLYTIHILPERLQESKASGNDDPRARSVQVSAYEARYACSNASTTFFCVLQFTKNDIAGENVNCGSPSSASTAERSGYRAFLSRDSAEDACLAGMVGLVEENNGQKRAHRLIWIFAGRKRSGSIKSLQREARKSRINAFGSRIPRDHHFLNVERLAGVME